MKCTQKNHDQWQTTSLISSDSTIHFLILAPREIHPEFKTFFLHRFSFYIIKTTGAGADLGDGARGSRSNPPEFKKMRHYNTLTWPQNTGNPISEDLNFKKIRMTRPRPLPPPPTLCQWKSAYLLKATWQRV